MAKIHELIDELDALTEELDALEAKRDQTRDTMMQLDPLDVSSEANREAAVRVIARLESEIEQKAGRVAQVETKLERERARRDALANLIDEREEREEALGLEDAERIADALDQLNDALGKLGEHSKSRRVRGVASWLNQHIQELRSLDGFRERLEVMQTESV